LCFSFDSEELELNSCQSVSSLTNSEDIIFLSLKKSHSPDRRKEGNKQVMRRIRKYNRTEIEKRGDGHKNQLNIKKSNNRKRRRRKTKIRANLSISPLPVVNDENTNRVSVPQFRSHSSVVLKNKGGNLAKKYCPKLEEHTTMFNQRQKSIHRPRWGYRIHASKI